MSEFLNPDLSVYDTQARQIVARLIEGGRDNVAKTWGRLCDETAPWRLTNALQFAPGRVPKDATTFFGLGENASFAHVLDKVETAIAASAKPRW